MFKPSRRAVAIAASFALGLSIVGPAAHAGLLGGDDSDSTSIEGLPLPVGGDLLGGLLGGGGGLPLVGDLLGGGGLPLVGSLLGGGSSSQAIGGDLLGGGGGLPLVGDLLGGGGGLPLVGDLLGGGGGLPLVGDLLGGVLGGGALGASGLPLVGGVLGGDGLLGGELLDVVTDTTLSCEAALPQILSSILGEATEAVCAPFSDGLLGLLGSL